MKEEKEIGSRNFDIDDALNRIERIDKPEKLNDFCDGETRKDILDAIAKRLLRLRGGCTCEDVLSNLRKKGYKV
jgi:hypothetical protein